MYTLNLYHDGFALPRPSVQYKKEMMVALKDRRERGVSDDTGNPVPAEPEADKPKTELKDGRLPLTQEGEGEVSAPSLQSIDTPDAEAPGAEV